MGSTQVKAGNPFQIPRTHEFFQGSNVENLDVQNLD